MLKTASVPIFDNPIFFGSLVALLCSQTRRTTFQLQLLHEFLENDVIYQKSFSVLFYPIFIILLFYPLFSYKISKTNFKKAYKKGYSPKEVPFYLCFHQAYFLPFFFFMLDTTSNATITIAETTSNTVIKMTWLLSPVDGLPAANTGHANASTAIVKAVSQPLTLLKPLRMNESPFCH